MQSSSLCSPQVLAHLKEQNYKNDSSILTCSLPPITIFKRLEQNVLIWKYTTVFWDALLPMTFKIPWRHIWGFSETSAYFIQKKYSSCFPSKSPYSGWMLHSPALMSHLSILSPHSTRGWRGEAEHRLRPPSRQKHLAGPRQT